MILRAKAVFYPMEIHWHTIALISVQRFLVETSSEVASSLAGCSEHFAGEHMS